MIKSLREWEGLPIFLGENVYGKIVLQHPVIEVAKMF